jgi:hydroxyacylglutathione hydrolase
LKNLKVRTLRVGQLATNCYLVSDNQSAIIIDPGDDADYIIQKINDLDLIPTKIIATHAHFDHIMAVNELKEAYNIPFLLHKSDVPLLKWMRQSALHFTKVDPGPAPKVDKFLKDKEELKTGNSKLTRPAGGLKIIHTPGHTPGGIVLYSNKVGVAFVGDTIFARGRVGRTDFPYCSKNDLQKSTRKLLKLPAKTICYPGHGPKTTIGKFSQQYTKNYPRVRFL